jgi:hypothetical protein
MPNHDWIRENLDAYLAGGLPAEERHDLEQHIATCAECAQVLADSRKMEKLMDDLFVASRPDAALEQRAIVKLRKARLRRASMLRFVGAAAAVLVLGLVGAAVQAITMKDSPFASIGRIRQRGFVQDARKYDEVAKSIDGEQVNEDHLEGKRETFSVVDVNPLGVEFDTDLAYKADRIEGISVPGQMNANEGVGIRDGDRTFGLGTGTMAGYVGGAGGHSTGNLFQSQTFYGRSGPTKEQERLAGGGVMDGTNGTAYFRETLGGGGRFDQMKSDFKQRMLVVAPPKDNGESPGGGSGPATKKPPEYFGLPAGVAQGPKTIPPPKVEEPKDALPLKKEEPATEKDKLLGANAFPPFTNSSLQSDKADPPAESGRKIIRTGEMEFEVESFDSAVDTVGKLAKGGFIATVNSDKLPNGKVRGSVVVRMPPQLLDKFILDLRRELGKTGELKSQRIGSQDVTKAYTDTESELRASRAVEARLLDIIKTGKGEIKDLIAAERELGTWRVKIEKMEGEIRYYNNQISLSTLTITLYEKEIQAASALVVNGKAQVRIEVDDVTKARETLEKAVKDLKGRLIKSDEKQHPAGQVEAIVHADIPPAGEEAFRKILDKVGIISAFEKMQTQTTQGGSGLGQNLQPRVNDVRFEVTLNNIVNIKPKHAVEMDVASADVQASYNKLRDEIVRVKGQIRDGKLNEQDKQKVTAFLDFNVPTEQKQSIDKKIAELGPMLKKSNSQATVTEISTDQKFGYLVSLYSVGSLAPHEVVQIRIEVKDVEKKAAELMDMAKASKGQAVKPQSGGNKQGQATTVVVMKVPLAASDLLVRQIKADAIKVVDWDQKPNSSAPENDLATAQIVVILTGGTPIIPNDEDLGSYVTSSLALSFRIFCYGVVFIILGLCAVLPWGLLILAGFWAIRKIWPAESVKVEPMSVKTTEGTPANP